MNVLLIDHYAGSPYHGMEYRPYYLGREWVRMGHNVTIVASSYSHLRTVNAPAGQERLRQEEIDGITYLWINTPRYYGNGVKRAINMFSFVSQLYQHRRTIVKNYKPDIVIASSTYPLDIYPAYAISRLNGSKLVFEVHDLWPLTPVELGQMSRLHPFVVVMQAAEDFAYRHANKVVSILPKALDYMVTRGLKPEKFVHIPNGIDIEEWNENWEELPEEHSSVISELKRNGKLLVCYAGSFGTANALDYFVESAKYVMDLPVVLLLVGQGPEEEKLQKLIRDNSFDNVVMLPPVPKKSIPSLLQQMDILYIGWRKSPLYRFGISPNKILDYMMAGKPIIHAVDAAANDLVAENQCGISVPPEDPFAISSAVRTLSMMSDVERQAIGIRGRAYVVKNHDYRVLAKHFLDAVCDT